MGVPVDLDLLGRVRFSPPNRLARFLASPIFNGRGASAITLGHEVYLLRPDMDFGSPEGVALLVHELKHVEQFEREGWLGFLARYLWDYLRHGYGKGIEFEREAMEVETMALAKLAGRYEGE